MSSINRRPLGARIGGLGGGLGSGLGWVLGAVALVLALRLVAALQFAQSPLSLHPALEDQGYQTRALEVREGHLLGRSLPRGSILYPILAGHVPGLRDGGSRSLAVAQAACEAVTVLLLALWIARRWGTVAAALAGVLYALDPLGGFFAARFTPVVPATTLFVAALWLWDRERTRGRAALSSTIGLSLVTAVGFLLAPLPFLFLAALRLAPLRQRGEQPAEADAPTSALSARAAAFAPAAVVLLVGAAVLLHHARLPGGGPALAWGQGISAYQAFHPVSRGTPRFIHPPAWFTEGELRAQAAEALHRQPEEYDLYRAYGGRGLRQTFGEPFTTAGILLAKAVVTIGAWPVPDALSPSFEASRHARPFAYLSWSFAVLLALGAAGFLARRGTGDRTAGTLLAGLVVVGAANLIGPASAAARQPALPLLAAFGGAWLAGHLPAQRGRGGARSRGALLGFGAALAVSVLAALLSPVRALRNPSEDLRLTAATFVQTQAWRPAVPLLEEAVRSDPANVEARLALASAYQADALPSAATQQLEAAYAADSTYAGVLFALARDRHEANRVEEALALLERLVSSHPNHPVYLRELAGMHTQAQNYARAEPLLQQAVRLDPQDQVASEALQQIVSLRLRLESALFPEEARLQEDPEFNAAIPRVVDAMEAGRWAEADSILDWAERERPTMALTSWLRGGYLARRGDLRGAAAALERCQQIAPGRPAVVAQLAKLYAQTGRRERIEPLLRSSLVAVGADSMAARQLRELMREIGIR